MLLLTLIDGAGEPRYGFHYRACDGPVSAMELCGFVTMMIFGVSYMLIPAFSHRPLYRLKPAQWQFWLFNIGTFGLVIGFSGLISGSAVRYVQVESIAIQAVAFYLHAYNIWRTAPGWQGSPGDVLDRSLVHTLGNG